MDGQNSPYFWNEIEPVAVPHILIVESDPGIAEVIQDVIKYEMRKHIMHTTTVHDALRVTKALKPLLFIIDERLSDGDGFVLYDQLHQRAGFALIPAIILSTNQRAIQQKIMERDLICLDLPLDIDDLIQTITALLPHQFV
ncbi:MAG TPA: response regulator [Ktedonobacteraceae bacterium]|nr:response regulator [Ktedonobacteraceae bacterium]